MNELKQRWLALQTEQPRLRIRDAAAHLGVSEAALLETRQDDGVTKLRADGLAICAALPDLGILMSLVRNDAAVHEKDIVFPAGRLEAGTMHFSGADFALDVDLAAIAHAFRVHDVSPKGELRSVQLFDAAGDALWKIYARDKADLAAFEQLASRLAHSAPTGPTSFVPRAPLPASAPGSVFAALQSVLERCAAAALPLRLDVGNRGVRQSHRGLVHRIVRMGTWLNVLDPGFDWHLDEAKLASIGIAGGLQLSLALPDGSEAARLSLDEATSPDQAKLWRDLFEQVPA